MNRLIAIVIGFALTGCFTTSSPREQCSDNRGRKVHCTKVGHKTTKADRSRAGAQRKPAMGFSARSKPKKTVKSKPQTLGGASGAAYPVKAAQPK